MPWTQKQMLRDANGDLIPQYWDVVEQEFKPLTGSDGANDVRLTGSNVEFGKTENVFERKIRTESEGSRVTKPKWAKGCLIELVIHGITGSFGTDEGVEMTTFSRFKGGIGTGTRLRSVDVTKTGTIQHLWFTGVSLDDAESSNIDFKLTNYPVAEEVAIGFTIIGNFESGEGIDSEINLFWMR